MSNKENIKISLFGGFTIQYKDKTVDVIEALGKKLVNVFEVLVLQAGKEVSSESFYNMFFEDAEDPRSSLKYTVFRLRKGLEDIKELEGLNLIKTCEEGYMLSEEYDYDIDVCRLNQAYEKIKNKTDLETADFNIGKEIVSLYKGRLYTNNRSPLNITLESETLSNEFVNTVVLMSTYLIKKERFEDMMMLNHEAIRIEPFYEGLHYYYMKGLIEIKDYHRALKYYDEINERFYNELGTGLSPLFKNLYNMISEEESSEGNKEIDVVKDEMNINMLENGGFFVTYELFKNIYELMLKFAKRDGKKYFLLMINVSGDIELKDRVSVSNKVKDIIAESIRTNDVFARINKTQFIILLECHEIDNVYIVAQRITSKFYKKYHQKNYRLNYNASAASKEKL